MMTQFCQRVANDPPISRTTKAPYSHDTLKNILMKIIQNVKEKFAGQTDNLPPLFQDASISQWKKIMQHGKSRTLMEGDKEGELFKSCFPTPKQHSRGTIFFLSTTSPIHSCRGQLERLISITLPHSCLGQRGLRNWPKLSSHGKPSLGEVK